jgi:hypothetical protein
MTASEYLPLWARALPAVMLAAAATVFAVVAVLTAVRGTPAAGLVVSLAALGAAALGLVAVPVVERRVLASAQPASGTVELAWDDLFRTDALLLLRMGAAILASIALGCAVSALVDPQTTSSWTMFPWWSVTVVQLLYLSRRGRLQPGLYPEDLRAAYAAEGLGRGPR